jgi:hypothetical protein
MMVNRRLAQPIFTLVAVLSISLSAACGSGDGYRFVVGQVTNVVPSSVTALAELELVDADGVVWQFKALGFVGQTPSHLEEHAATGQSIRVEYFEADGHMIISAITD